MRYDLFFAYASVDRERTRPLLGALRDLGLRVFQDVDTPLGETWDTFIPAAQRHSRATVACISAAYVQAFYVRAEVHDALGLARRSAHRLFPVYLDGPPGSDDVLYGLRMVQGIVLPEHGVQAVARRIAEGLGEVVEAPPIPGGVAPGVLLDALKRLAPASFAELVVRTGIDHWHLLPDSVEQARRAINLIEHAAEAGVDLVGILRGMRQGMV